MQIKISEKTRKAAVSDPRAVAQILADILKAEDGFDKVKEHFWGIYLDARNYIARIELISLGTLNASLIHPRETLKPAIEGNAAQFIVAHNHPSGEVEPSEDDLTITRRLTEAAKIMGIELLDHIIINSKGGFYSFKGKGLI